MCDTTYHREEDTVLLNVTPAEMGQRREPWLARLRGHPYGEECCTIELVGDGLVRPRFRSEPGQVKWFVTWPSV